MPHASPWVFDAAHPYAEAVTHHRHVPEHKCCSSLAMARQRATDHLSHGLDFETGPAYPIGKFFTLAKNIHFC